MLTLSLLSRVGTAEEIIENAGDHDGTLNAEQFIKLCDDLELGASPDQVREIFAEMDADGSGSIDAGELKASLRNSGAVKTMYDTSLRNVALTLIPTAGVAALFVYFKGVSSGLDFLAGYVVEDSLSVDNLFVFLALFKIFKVPSTLQSFCLNLGIIGAVVLRAFFIFAGLAAVKSFQPLLLIFAAFLIYTSFNMITADDDDDDEEEELPSKPVQTILDLIPTTDKFDGDKLFVQDPKGGGWLATPLALCIIAVELSDILFAVDSIPAVFAITDDPLIVYSSNIAAIVGLRSLYQLLAIAVQDLVYLEKAVAIVLGFVGAKLAAEVAGIEVPSLATLAIIVTTLGGGVVASLNARKEE